MNRELIENLREYADIAEAGDKSHWADAMRQAAEYMRTDLDKTLPEPVATVGPHYQLLWMIDYPTRIVKVGSKLYAEPQAIHDKGEWSISDDGLQLSSDDFTHDVVLKIDGDFEDIYQRKAYANGLANLLNAEPTARKPMTEEEFLNLKLPCDIKIGNGKNGKGTTIRTLLLRANNIYDGAMLIKHKSLSDAESYSDALRSLASYVGCGGYNANDPIDAKEFEEKIRYGIDLLLAAQSHQCAVQTARGPLSDDVRQLAIKFESIMQFARAIERAHDIGGDNGNT